MLLAIGAASSLVDALASLTSSQSSSATTSTNPNQAAQNPFDLGASTQGQVSTGLSTGTSGPQISPQTMSALIQAQSQSGTTNTAPTNPNAALQDLFSQIDTNGDGQITKQEFENALGAGGTNIAAADDVFNQLSQGTGSITLDDLKSALQGAGHHGGGHHHMHAGGAGGAGDANDSNNSTSADGSTDPLLQALAGASSTSVTNSDGSTTTSITYPDGSKVSMTTPAASSSSSSNANSATSSYNWIEQMIQREAQALSSSAASSLSVNA